MGKHPKFKTRAIVFTAKEKAELISNISCPEVDDETVVIQAKISGLSRGTETDMYTGNFHGPEYSFPLITGYEPVGRAIFVGKKITHIKEGDLAVGFNLLPDSYPKSYCSGWGGAVEYAVYNRSSASPLWYSEEFCAGRRVARVPNSLDEKDGIFGVLGGVAYHGVQRVGVKRDDKVVIIGLGVIGNCAAQFCQSLGARVIAFDLHELRCEIARKCGIRSAVNASKYDIKEIVASYTGGSGADVVIECSGEVQNIDLCVDIAGNDGRVHLQGAYLEPYAMIVQKTLFGKNLSMSSSCGATPHHIDQVFQQMVNKQLVVRPMITHILPVKDVQKGYQLNLHNPDKSLKIGFLWK
ncbi:MAG: zinc-binding dehydrogenase [Candidatus Firestonebacteria bacterium]